jgi:hypothetical protein
MDVEPGLMAIPAFTDGSQTGRLIRLDDLSARFVFIASAFMKRSGGASGAERHRLLHRLLGAGVRTEGDLRSWMRENLAGAGARLWGNAGKQADRYAEAGVKVFAWSAAAAPHVEKEEHANSFPAPLDGKIPSQWISEPCPAVLFGKGRLNLDLPLVGVFNSRKPRNIAPDADWLEALRYFFRNLDRHPVAFAGSMGTLTHDLVGAHLLRSELSQLIVAPFPLLKAEGELFKTYGEAAGGMPVLSCMLDSVCRPKSRAPVCRDRIIGMLASIHLILEIRSRGNLSAVLEELQAKSPGFQLIFDPEVGGLSNAGNKELLKKFPEFAHRFTFPRSRSSPGTRRRDAEKVPFLRCGDVDWDDYLFHYTRGCAGPWPGETYREYLLSLFDAGPLCGHSALETLIRILQDGSIRAGSGMIRGDKAVICWSSHPPRELFQMRKWNRTLARWTVEPYGIAVRRDILRSLGVKPAVYGNESVYSRLAEPERYRFQLSRSSGSASWRQEREWRLLGDLALGGIKPGGGFAFVRTAEERDRLLGSVDPEMPIVALDG